jgi:tetratricopeptide (TPR) repeat protein
MSQTARRVQRRHLPATLAVVCLVLPVTLYAQEAPQNLQVLPKDMPRSQVTQIMRGFTRALGVRCSNCHVGEEGQPLSTYDFASDDKPMKLTAREMLRMVGAINGTYLSNLPNHHGESVQVTCVTCHRGVRHPEPIEAIVQATTGSEGIDAALAEYRELREQYYGASSYDFTERPLLSAAQAVGEAGAARRILEMNLEFHPNSAFTMFALGQILADAGEKDQAIGLYRRGLEIMPDNPQAQRRLRELTGGL